jgi:hypothetical protein
MLTNRVVSDGIISIELNDVQRTDHYPSEIGDIVKLPRIRSGNDLIVIYLTILKIEKGHIPYYEGGLIPVGVASFTYVPTTTGSSVFSVGPSQSQITTLLDSTGKQYYGFAYIEGFVQGNGTSGNSEYIEGTKFIYTFECPREINPLKLVFMYPFKQSLSQSSIEWHSLDL